MLDETSSGSKAHLVSFPSGKGYRVDSAPEHALVTPELAAELRRVLDRFAWECGYSEGNPVSLFFKPGVVGHHKVGRAADIYAVGKIGLGRWKQRWDKAMSRAVRIAHRDEMRKIVREERRSNLGWRLYKALQLYGRWAQPYGYPIQLFGPWTRSEGPWSFISDPLLYAHRDHIHVAK